MADTRTGTGAGFLLTVSLCSALAGMALVFVMIAAFSLPVFFSGQNGGTVFSRQWLPSAGSFGITPMLVGSLLLALVSVVLAWPIALGFSSITLTARSKRARIWAGRLVRLMASVPTVVYAFAAVFLVAPLVRRALGGGSGLGLLTAAPVLALLVFPTMVVVMQAGMRDRMAEIWPAAASLGLCRMQAMAHLVIPASVRSLAAAAGLGAARAIGDTMISLMLAGNAVHFPGHLTDGLRTLTAHMALVTANEVGGAAYDSLFAAGALALLASCGISMVVRRFARAKNENGC